MDTKEQSLVPGTAGTPDDDPSELWAILEPPRSRDDAAADRIIALLRTVPVAEDLEPLRTLALDGDPKRRLESGRAALALARRILATDPEDGIDDTGHSWLWLAAHRGSATATLLLVNALVDRAKTVQREARRKDAAARKRVQALQALACGWFDQVLSVWLWEPEIQELPRIFADNLNEPSVHEGPTRVVIESWPTQHARSGLEEYKVLAQPVPLVGGDKNVGGITDRLRSEFPWMEEAIDRVADDLALCGLGAEPWARIRPLLHVGPPGSGKTRLARRLAELIGTGYLMISASGSSDDRSLVGTAHGWANHEPSAILRLMLSCNAANPLIIVDELEKSGGSERNGDIRRSLLGLLEPETARRWYDECLQCHCDASGVSWILTANSLEPISRPLLSRMAIARVGMPGPDAIEGILDGMRLDIALDLGLDPALLPEIDPAARRALADAFGRGRSLRSIRAALVRAMAAGVRRGSQRN